MILGFVSKRDSVFATLARRASFEVARMMFVAANVAIGHTSPQRKQGALR